MYSVISLCHFCEHHGPSVMFSCEKVLSTNGANQIQGATQVKSENKQLKKTDLCQACRSLPENAPGYVSNDKDTGESFVSTQHPHDPDMFRIVRQACVRSLSCEVCPGREGPIMFGDDENGYVISYTFYVQDNSARGLRRWYSIICIMDDRVFLIQSWPFFVGCIKKIINYLQECANKVYTIETSLSSLDGARLKGRMSNSVTPKNFRQHRGDNSNARALIELTGDKNLYAYLHTAFTWIIRACRKRLKEQVVHGSMMHDDIVRAEILARNSRSNSLISESDMSAADLNSQVNSLRINDGSEGYFTSLRHMREVLQPPLFKAIAWHLLIGNQVIWRGQNQEIVSSALHVLKEILPLGCIKMVLSSDVYVDSYKANLLGLKENVPLPTHLKSSELYILIDVVAKVTTTQKLNQLYPSLFDNNQPVLSNGIEFRMTSGCVIPEKGPIVVNKLEVALANDSLSPEVVKHCLVCIKDEWMSKVKILYKFTKIDNRSKEDTTKMIQTCLNCSEEDVRLLKFWMTGLSCQFKEQLRSSAKNKIQSLNS